MLRKINPAEIFSGMDAPPEQEQADMLGERWLERAKKWMEPFYGKAVWEMSEAAVYMDANAAMEMELYAPHKFLELKGEFAQWQPESPNDSPVWARIEAARIKACVGGAKTQSVEPPRL